MSDELAERPKHPLTQQFIALVGGGADAWDATLSLVGPLLHIQEAQEQYLDWSLDGRVQAQINRQIKNRFEAVQGIRETTLERLMAVINQDVRKYFRLVESSPGATRTEMIPIPEWSKWMAGAVKKIKITSKTDPFGSATDTVNLEFYDPQQATRELQRLAPEVYDIVKLSDKDNAIDIKAFESMSDAELDELHAKLLKAV